MDRTPTQLTTASSARRWSEDACRAGHSVALVPTMGALHEGHLALVEEARQRADRVVVSIFVNPLQFDRDDDFEHYPRALLEDIEICARVGVDAVYVPQAEEMYPPGFDTRVEPGRLAAGFEGAGRPGHFTGVTTIVTKLLTAVRPHLTVFGEKDAQQLAIVRRMVLDLDLGVSVVAVPTVREPDGLALSSRNSRLDPADRSAAVCLPRALDAAVRAAQRGVRHADDLLAPARAILDEESRARTEYLAVVDPDEFVELADLDAGSHLIIAAVWFGSVRLIDNRRFVV